MLADSLMEVGQFSESEMHYLLLPSAFESQTMDGKQNDGKDSSNERDKALIKLYQLLKQNEWGGAGTRLRSYLQIFEYSPKYLFYY